jgi:chorismate mutase/prephenate dehydratase
MSHDLPSAGPTKEALEQLRRSIDRIDDQIHDLLMKRGTVVRKVGEVKGCNPNAVFYRPEREAQIHRRLEKRHTGPMPVSALHRIYREIISACLCMEKQLTAVYLGPEATFTHQAALKHFGSAFHMYAGRSINDVFHEVEVGRADFGVVPVENSIEGVVHHTLDCFVDSPLKICAEILLPAMHNLVSRVSNISQIRQVYGHQQATDQCKGWLVRHLPDAKVIAVESTARAAELARDKKRAAAIAGVYAADRFGLTILAEHIEDSASSEDRFLVIAPEAPTKPSGLDKTSLMVSFRDQTGFLHKVLGIFAEQEINLTRIESRPSKRKAWDYLFFIDLDGHPAEPKVAEALNRLMVMPGVNAKILGHYPRRAL